MCKVFWGYSFGCKIVLVSRRVKRMQGLIPFALPQVVCEVGKAVGAEGLVAGQIVDIKSEGMAEQVSCICAVPCSMPNNN